ncbi:LLM class flavin-dependent oxidoreductase [Allonocardiopsis opalescens]|uniref:Alkanesulfonate monooxygenase SsuD/methylene tetrahydromethanopterin reductase-like flavin-dependent oxidoreductase (Luciferase family) n=1 Tax=Allonocardiopsis opalescens TaxID=1144618 RepID=A0A2T0Q546_9ACTN|nr:LLM class flavin-dependent oxidoreductase [Allonocardiopsis opalescens]PRX98831.1 alkanesulfonate monooxygenase SsuD/methylene tetrahydromethanopterin reductase-like flavin-dependent oxidoreductase (luciferase family) [Allonocardiopsis opalescens]
MDAVRIGIGLPTMDEARHLGAAGVVAAARRAEALGMDSVGAPDVLIGDGTAALDSIVVLSAVAAATERVALEFGVLSLPTRPVAMLAAQIQTLQHLSGGRVRLGVGIGGFPGSPFWQAVGAPATGRGRLADAALRVLPGLIAGEPTVLPDAPGRPSVTLAPGAAVPPILIGGGATEPALRRTAAYGDGWLPSALTTAELAEAAERLRALAAEYGRPAPRIHIGLHAVLGEDPADTADRDAVFGRLAGFFQMTPEQTAQVTVTGGPREAADRLAAYAEAGVDEIGLAIDGRDFMRQLDLIAEARSHL